MIASSRKKPRDGGPRHEAGRQVQEVAERQGFEPWIRCRIPDFESGAFDHSAISPERDYTATPAPASGFRRPRFVPPSIFRFLFLAAFAALLGGCASTPPGADVPKTASTALQTPES